MTDEHEIDFVDKGLILGHVISSDPLDTRDFVSFIHKLNAAIIIINCYFDKLNAIVKMTLIYSY
jgi:hypothetical protein